MDKEKPIGVFDSGIGGLTVVKRLASILPNESIVYFGDTARVPYGSKSNETIIEYSIQDAKFLLSKNVKAIVVACNTASSAALPELRKVFNLPLIGMVESGALYALKQSKNKKIGVIGTRATINNSAYEKEIKRLEPSAEVFGKACPLFVPLAEEGWIDHKAAYEIANEYLTELKNKEIDTLVLGCTHYPILAETIQNVIGKDVKLVDSGIAAAEMVKEELLRRDFNSNSNAAGNLSCYLTDITPTFQKIVQLFLGRSVKEVQKVDLETLAV